MLDRSSYYRFPSRDGLVASTLLEYLHQGGRDPQMMRAAVMNSLEQIRTGVDCADFHAASLTLVLYRFGELLPADLTAELKIVLLAFPYEDCGGHSMCTWTENHRLYLADSEYLLAARFPDETFGDGRPAAYHLETGRKAILRWNREVAEYGFGEWGSNNYFAETLAAISVNFECTKEEAVRESSRHSLNLLLTEILARSAGVSYNPAASRAYVDNKVSAQHGNYLYKQLSALLYGTRFDTYKDKEAAFIFLLDARDEAGRPLYELPPAVRAFWQQPAKETAISEGVDIRDYRRLGLLSYRPEHVRYAMQAGAISDARIVSHTFRYLDESGLAENGLFSAFRPLIKPVLYRGPLLRIIKRFVPLIYDAAAHGEGRAYTYATEKVSFSALDRYRVGKPLFQQNPFSVNLSPEVSLFATNPYKPPEKTGSPDYWIGSASAPRAEACGLTLAALYRPRKGKNTERMTHLFFPTEAFDEVDLSRLPEGLVFGRTNGVNIMVRTNPGVAFRSVKSPAEDLSLRQDKKIPVTAYGGLYDLVNRSKGVHYYLFEADESLPFEEFVKTAGARPFRKAGGRIFFEDARHAFTLRFRGRFTEDGAPVRRKYLPISQFYKNLITQEVSHE